MMFTIHKGTHRAWPVIIGLHIHQWIERDVVFNETAAYEVPKGDADDVNKLFGFGYFKGFHHTDSARFGWNYNSQTGRVNLFAYCYVNGKRSITYLCDVLPHKKLRCKISIMAGSYVFTINDGYNNWHEIAKCDIKFTHSKHWRYRLGCYFGGNQKAPQTIRIYISKK